jgi:hypothetical protein
MPNNGMHPTADTPALIYLNRPGRRVMAGVGVLPHKHTANTACNRVSTNL